MEPLIHASRQIREDLGILLGLKVQETGFANVRNARSEESDIARVEV